MQDGIAAEIMALAQGHNDIAELLTKLKPVSNFKVSNVSQGILVLMFYLKVFVYYILKSIIKLYYSGKKRSLHETADANH